MDAKEAFKQGFLARCIEQGLTTPAAIDAHLKRAGATEAVLGLVRSGLGIGLPVLAVGPAAIGAGLGALTAKATDIDDVDAKAIKQQEIIAELKRQAALIRQRHGLRR